MRIATWNVNGIRARQSQFLEWVAVERPDVICLQEIKAKREQLPPEVCDLAGYWCYWHGAGGYSGVSLQVSRESCPEEPTFHHPEFDYENRIVTADVAGTTVASIYVPNGGKDYGAKLEFLQSLGRWAAAATAAGRTLVLCGDLNVALTDRDVHPKELKPGVIGQRPEERALIDGLLRPGLVDLGRALDPDNDQLFTWWAPWRNMRQRNIGWRIDYILASAALAAKAAECRVRAEVGTSDHAPVVATFVTAALAGA